MRLIQLKVQIQYLIPPQLTIQQQLLVQTPIQFLLQQKLEYYGEMMIQVLYLVLYIIGAKP